MITRQAREVALTRSFGAGENGMPVAVAARRWGSFRWAQSSTPDRSLRIS
jgi:hypothetical protein